MIEQTLAALTLSYAYLKCMEENFYDSSKPIVNKLFSNAKNALIGMFVGTLFFNHSVFVNLSIFDEITSVITYSLCMEFAFYWIHRLQHAHPWIYKTFHKHHHLETSPHPIDAYDLSSGEACLITFALLFPNIIGIYTTYRAMTLVIVSHLTVAILIHGSPSVVRYLPHHMVHHKKFVYNYCGTYPLWDIIFNTYST